MRSSAVAPRVVVWAGGALFWVVQLTLLLVFRVPVVDTILLSLLLTVVPALSLAQLSLIDDVVIERLPAYWGTIGTLWLLGTACWLVGTRVGGAAAVGIVLLPALPLLAWSLVLTLAGLATIFAFRWLGRAWGVPEKPLLRQLLPRTRRERRVFAVVSVAAGLGEEIAYRGYAIPMLAPLLTVPGAAVLTSAVFGVLHGYQGLLGIFRTGIMGGLLAWGFLASGSLWPPIVAHTLIDLLAGLVLADSLLSTGPPADADGSEFRSSNS